MQRRQRAGRRGGGDEQERAHRELQRRRAGRAADGRAELHVGRGTESALPRSELAPPPGEPTSLPIAGERRERADAARNRERVLAAARELFAERGVERVTMEEVARRAGVAKGTVFHRFGDRTGLALALLDEHKRAVQDEVVHGEPPLGPGAPPLERLLALLDALIDLLERHGDLLYAAETGKAGARYATGAYAAWHQHVAVLLRELGVDGDPEVLADAVLAPLAAELYTHLRRGRGLDAEQVRDAVHGLVRGLAGAPTRQN
jgi:AcrR family transcriptional regulator